MNLIRVKSLVNFKNNNKNVSVSSKSPSSVKKFEYNGEIYVLIIFLL